MVSQALPDREGILDVDYLCRPGAVNDTDNIEPIRVGNVPPLCHPVPRRARHFALLAPVDSAERSSERRGDPRLYFNERDHASFSANSLYDEVDISMIASKATIENPPAMLDQPLLRYQLAPLAELLPRRCHRLNVSTVSPGRASSGRRRNRIHASVVGQLASSRFESHSAMQRAPTKIGWSAVARDGTDHDTLHPSGTCGRAIHALLEASIEAVTNSVPGSSCKLATFCLKFAQPESVRLSG
jgi:hypothetical protein